MALSLLTEPLGKTTPEAEENHTTCFYARQPPRLRLSRVALGDGPILHATLLRMQRCFYSQPL